MTQLSVFPNPVSSHLEIMLPKNAETTGLTVLVYNIVGTQMQVPFNIKSNSIQLDIQALPQGMYIIELSSKGQFLGREKIMKQ